MSRILAKKSLGQNFLIDSSVVHHIADSTPSSNELLLEVGPGQGALSSELAKKAKILCLVEKDEKLLAGTKTRLFLEGHQNIHTWPEDILYFDLNKLWKETGTATNKKLTVIANLPYNIATEILIRFISRYEQISFMLLMFQKEVGERIAAKPGSKKYSSLSVLAQNFYEIECTKIIKPAAFRPQPKVESVVIRFQKRAHPRVVLNEAELERFQLFVRGCFAQRRKTVENSLSQVQQKWPWRLEKSKENIQKLFHDCQIDSKRRAETLSLEEYGKLFFQLESYEAKANRQ